MYRGLRLQARVPSSVRFPVVSSARCLRDKADYQMLAAFLASSSVAFSGRASWHAQPHAVVSSRAFEPMMAEREPFALTLDLTQEKGKKVANFAVACMSDSHVYSGMIVHAISRIALRFWSNAISNSASVFASEAVVVKYDLPFGLSVEPGRARFVLSASRAGRVASSLETYFVTAEYKMGLPAAARRATVASSLVLVGTARPVRCCSARVVG